MALTEEVNVWVACGDGNLELVKEMIEERGIDVNAKDSAGYTPIHAAVSWNHNSLVNYLLEKGADIDIRDADGDSPLHVCESRDMAQLIIDAGARPMAVNNEGQTAVDCAREENNIEMLELYHEMGLVTNDELAAAIQMQNQPDSMPLLSSGVMMREEGEDDVESESDDEEEEREDGSDVEKPARQEFLER